MQLGQKRSGSKAKEPTKKLFQKLVVCNSSCRNPLRKRKVNGFVGAGQKIFHASKRKFSENCNIVTFGIIGTVS
jgi:hypothetical protein